MYGHVRAVFFDLSQRETQPSDVAMSCLSLSSLAVASPCGDMMRPRYGEGAPVGSILLSV